MVSDLMMCLMATRWWTYRKSVGEDRNRLGWRDGRRTKTSSGAKDYIGHFDEKGM